MRQAIARLGLAAADGVLGADAAYALAGRLAGGVLRGATPRLARATAEAFPDRDSRWIARTVRAQLCHRAWLALDKHTLPTLSGDALRARVDGLEGFESVLASALDAGRGAILYSIHYGRPLVLPPLLASLSVPSVQLVAPRARDAAPDAIVVGTDATRAEMVAALAGNRVLTLLVDTPLARQTVSAPFLGARLPAAVGLAAVVWESSAALVAVTVRSLAPFRFALAARTVALTDESMAPAEVGRALLEPFEDDVRADPGGWYGVNRVFRAVTSGFPV